jgi:hypothetical protein
MDCNIFIAAFIQFALKKSGLPDVGEDKQVHWLSLLKVTTFALLTSIY